MNDIGIELSITEYHGLTVKVVTSPNLQHEVSDWSGGVPLRSQIVLASEVPMTCDAMLILPHDGVMYCLDNRRRAKVLVEAVEVIAHELTHYMRALRDLPDTDM